MASEKKAKKTKALKKEKAAGKKARNLKEALEGKLSKKEMDELITSFDSLGNIAVIQVPKGLVKKAKVIGEALLSLNKQFETVCMISGEHKGLFRVQPVKVVAGKRNKKAFYRESGCSFFVELGKAFFSSRLGTERARIASLIKKGEVVGCFFAGVGPFPIVFAKNSGMKKAYAIELNPDAFKSMVENIALNKVQEKVEPILGDVHKVVPKMLLGKCDRIVMPLPKGGESFLEEAMLALKKEGGTIHFYRFVERGLEGKEAVEEVKRAAEKAGINVKFLRKKRVRSFSAKVEQFVLDFFAKQGLGKRLK